LFARTPGAQKCHSPLLALFRVFCWDFAVTMITVAVGIALDSGHVAVAVGDGR
jgi:hypothetical protein